jgi:hypothetical protein
VIGLLARRTLFDRPKRTAFLLLGFGIAVGVMIVLLSIGEAVLEQARDKDLVGGGDLVLLPEGVDVEVMKVGGATGMFFAIENARFFYRQVLSGPRWRRWMQSVPAPAWPGEPPAPALAAVNPTVSGKLVYMRRAGSDAAPVRVLASGVIPSLERAVRGPEVTPSGAPIAWDDSHADRLWLDPPVDSLYNEMDRFHLPARTLPNLDTWAEWLYFNFAEPRSGAYGFLSFIAAGDIAAGSGRALPLLQIVPPDGAPLRFQGDLPLAPDDIGLDRVALRFGAGTSVVFRDGAYRLQFDWRTPSGDVRGALTVRPIPDLYFPPFPIHASERFVSGYTVPAVRAVAEGWIEAGGRRLELHEAPAYHDHNWGTWRDVHWDWGTAAAGEYALFYGRVEHPELHPGRDGAGLFALLMRARRADERGGVLGLFRPQEISYTWNAPPPLPGNPARVPAALAFSTTGEETYDSLAVTMRVDRVLATAPRPGQQPLVFLQARGAFDIHARIAGAPVEFTAPGAAEVFVPSRTP